MVGGGCGEYVPREGSREEGPGEGTERLLRGIGGGRLLACGARARRASSARCGAPERGFRAGSEREGSEQVPSTGRGPRRSREGSAVCTAQSRTRLYFGCISAASRLHLGYTSAISRLHLGLQEGLAARDVHVEVDSLAQSLYGPNRTYVTGSAPMLLVRARTANGNGGGSRAERSPLADQQQALQREAARHHAARAAERLEQVALPLHPATRRARVR